MGLRNGSAFGSVAVSRAGEWTFRGQAADLGDGPPAEPAPELRRMKRYEAPSLVESYGAVTARQLYDGLGFNAQNNANVEWVVRMAKEAGATTLRWQPGWERNEDMNGVLALDDYSAEALRLCGVYGLQPILVAAYGPPRAVLATVTVAVNVPQGSYSVRVTEDISAVTPQNCFVQAQSGGADITDYHAYYGSMIDKTDPAARTIGLAAKTRMPLSAGTKLVIRRLRYAPVFSTDPQDPSNAAYCRYVRFLAQEIASRGLKGQVEIWNEPVWDNDRWDAGPLFYDNDANPNRNPHQVDVEDLSPRHKGILFNLMNGPALPEGVTINNGSTHITGFPTMLQWMPTAAQIEGKVETESFHPYGISPESFAWYNDVHPYVAPVGIPEGGNFKWYMEELDALRETGAVVPYPSITETGVSTPNETVQARYILRQFLLAHSLGYRFVNIYALAEDNENYPLVNPSTGKPKIAYDALKDLVATRLAALAGNPLALSSDDLPRVTQYAGSWPLAVVPILGRGTTMMLCLWQRTYGDFIANPPTAAPETVAIRLPEGSAVDNAWDTVTRQLVPWTVSGDTVTCSVSDNPIAISLTLAVPLRRPAVRIDPAYSQLPGGAVWFPFQHDSRSTDRKAAFYDGETRTDLHVIRNRFSLDPAVGKYVRILPSCAFNLKGWSKQNWGWGAWVYIPDGLGNEATQQLFVTASPASYWGSLAILGTRFARLYGTDGGGNAVEAGTLNGVSTYPFRGKWRYVFCSWGPGGTRLYIDGQLHALAPEGTSTDDFGQPAIHSNTTDLVCVRDMVFVPYQPSDEEVARWSSEHHRWLAASVKEPDFTFYWNGPLTAATYPQTWVSPYFFTIRNIAAVAAGAPSANLSVQLLVNNVQAAALTVPTTGAAETAGLAVPVNAGDRLSIRVAAPASGRDLTVVVSGD